jgi:hypothetical protein
MSAAVEDRLQEIRSRKPTAADATWLLDLVDRLQDDLANGRRTDGFVTIGEAVDRVIASMRIVGPGHTAGEETHR